MSNPFDRPLPADVQEILDTAAVLQTNEFHVFELSYERWFGQEADERLLQRSFFRYLYLDLVPHWVRQFTRHVMELYRAGRLDPSEFGIYPPPLTHADVYRGYRYIAVVIVVLLVLFMAIPGTSEFLFPVLGSCHFPPCY